MNEWKCLVRLGKVNISSIRRCTRGECAYADLCLPFPNYGIASEISPQMLAII